MIQHRIFLMMVSIVALFALAVCFQPLYSEVDEIVIIDDDDEAVVEPTGAEENAGYEWVEREEEAGEFEELSLQEEEIPLVFDPAAAGPEFEMQLREYEMAGWVTKGKGKLPYDGVIIRAYSRRKMMATGETVIIDGGKDGAQVEVGEEYSIFRRGELISHPLSKQPVGYRVVVVGYLRVSEIKEGRALAVVEEVYSQILVGDKLRRRELVRREYETQNVRPHKIVEGYVRSNLIWAEHYYPRPGEFVCLDRGRNANLVSGVIMRVYSWPKDMNPNDKASQKYKFEVGKLRLLRVDDTTSVAQIISAREGIKVGRQAILRAE